MGIDKVLTRNKPLLGEAFKRPPRDLDELGRESSQPAEQPGLYSHEDFFDPLMIMMIMAIDDHTV